MEPPKNVEIMKPGKNMHTVNIGLHSVKVLEPKCM